MIKISAVSYTNTLPFIYGLTHSSIYNKISLCLDVPAQCANKLITNQVDIGLVPVAAILNIPEANIISDYCIGANGAVNSVFIFSNCPIKEVTHLQLDAESKTSNQLALILAKHFWKITPKLVSNAINYAHATQATTAYVQIGDRTFGQQIHFKYVYDLPAEWQSFTGLPFVFALWVSNKKLNNKFITELNTALKFGLDNRAEVIKNFKKIPNFDISDYLYHKIDYNLDNSKKQALSLFNQYINY